MSAPESRKTSSGEVTSGREEVKEGGGEKLDGAVAYPDRIDVGSPAILWNGAYDVLEPLRQAGIGVSWIGEGLRWLSNRAAQADSLASDLAFFQEQVRRAADLAVKVGETRARIAALESQRGVNAAECLAAAEGQVEEAASLLGRGDVDNAMVVLEQAGWLATEAEALLRAGRAG